MAKRSRCRSAAKAARLYSRSFPRRGSLTAFALLRELPGRRLFQYLGEDKTVRAVRARDVNAFLREIAGEKISLKDFRTLLASASVLETLARAAPGEE